ncbi:MAG: A24 family peptidase [Nanoarchaeota archaeon]|mgnify:FL=1
MGEYIFLYIIGFIAILFAVIQDLRTREIANWLTFSLIAFVLAYRAIYSIYSNNFMFFVYGLFGIFLFVGLGYLFYYARVFAGGDAKLLFGLGGIFPYSSLFDYAYYGVGFILLLFTSGVIYTLFYSFFLVRQNYNDFKKSFVNQIKRLKYFFIVSIILAILVFFTRDVYDSVIIINIFAVFVLLSPFLFAYVRAVEKSCMIQLISPDKLTEGDWLERDVYVNGKVIKKNFAGLNFNQILILRKRGKKVMIKTGVPFAPAFLLALLFFYVYIKVL